MTSKLEISNSVTDEQRIAQSDLFQLFGTQETPTEFIDWYWDRYIPQEALTYNTRTITIVAKVFNMSVLLWEIILIFNYFRTNQLIPSQVLILKSIAPLN